MYSIHSYCRACGYANPGAEGIKSGPGSKLIEVFDLGIQPLANDFCKTGQECAGYAPLKVLLCPNCSLAQLSVTVRPDILYSHYSYVTSPSETMLDHFNKLITDVESETKGKSVVEIGSNDGRLLKVMQDKGYSVFGVDPAENLAKIARENGVLTKIGFFGQHLAEEIPKCDIVIARHVFCHVDDWKDFVRGLELISLPNTVICIEVPYVGDMLKNCEFDTIYHEHLSYLSIRSINALLEDSNLRLHRIIRYPIHGGALLLMLTTREFHHLPHTSVHEFRENIGTFEWADFSEEAQCQIDRLKAAVKTLISQKKRVAALGASAKSTVWINACGFTRKEINFIADNTHQKQWTFSPGSDIPIVDEGAILRDLPDYVVVFCWNYREEILRKFKWARSKGVKFIFPVPKIETV